MTWATDHNNAIDSKELENGRKWIGMSQLYRGTANTEYNDSAAAKLSARSSTRRPLHRPVRNPHSCCAHNPLSDPIQAKHHGRH